MCYAFSFSFYLSVRLSAIDHLKYTPTQILFLNTEIDANIENNNQHLELNILCNLPKDVIVECIFFKLHQKIFRIRLNAVQLTVLHFINDY